MTFSLSFVRQYLAPGNVSFHFWSNFSSTASSGFTYPYIQTSPSSSITSSDFGSPSHHAWWHGHEKSSSITFTLPLPRIPFEREQPWASKLVKADASHAGRANVQRSWKCHPTGSGRWERCFFPLFGSYHVHVRRDRTRLLTESG